MEPGDMSHLVGMQIIPELDLCSFAHRSHCDCIDNMGGGHYIAEGRQALDGCWMQNRGICGGRLVF